MTVGSITEPPSATRADRLGQLVDVGHALLEQVAAAGGAVLEQRERVVGLGVLAEQQHADLRVLLRRRARCWMPSSVSVGGMRMSVTTTSGDCVSISALSAGRSAAEPTSSRPGRPR